MLWLTRNTTQQTRVSPEEIVTLLQPDVLEPTVERADCLKAIEKREKPLFQGKLSAQGFELQRVVKGKTTFIPIIKGTMKETPSGRTDVVMQYKLHPLAYWMSSFKWAFLIALVGGFLLTGPLNEQFMVLSHQPRLLFTGLFLVVFSLHGTFKFDREVRTWETFFEESLKRASVV